MLAFTEMMYLPPVSEEAEMGGKRETYAMAKKVARPARASVKKFEPFRSFGYGATVQHHHGAALAVFLTCPLPSSLNQRPTGLLATLTLMLCIAPILEVATAASNSIGRSAQVWLRRKKTSGGGSIHL
jgi:hypothetical protein